MDNMPTALDCQSILEMMQEVPETAAVIIDMIAELEETDQNCLKKVREVQARNTAATLN
jgi:hypothetical protein